jgi:hypothetical protein
MPGGLVFDFSVLVDVGDENSRMVRAYGRSECAGFRVIGGRPLGRSADHATSTSSGWNYWFCG